MLHVDLMGFNDASVNSSVTFVTPPMNSITLSSFSGGEMDTAAAMVEMEDLNFISFFDKFE